MTLSEIQQMAQDVSGAVADLSQKAKVLEEAVQSMSSSSGGALMSPFLIGLTVFVLAVFIGYYVIWKVTPALHSPLMAVTNAISSVIIVGALYGASAMDSAGANWMGFLAIILASINIFGGFIVTRRMLDMFNRK